MRIISIANQKGGCGKTTTAVNLAAALARRSYRVLIIDLDPQGHTTLGLGCNPEELDVSIYEVLTSSQVSVSKVIMPTYISGLSLVPSNILLSGAELELSVRLGRELILGEELKMVRGEYEFCIIDCGPSLGMLTINALVASTDVIIPVQVHYYAMEGLRQLLDTINIVRGRFHPCKVEILGILLTFVESRTVLSREIQRQMREYFGNLVFDTVIHRAIRLAEAPSAGESILTYEASSKAAFEYLALADEVTNGQRKTWTT